MEKSASLLSRRNKTHGDFGKNAETSQRIKRAMHQAPNWDKLTSAQVECLEMISLKISRILSGDTCFRDHWADIAGYAILGAENSPDSMPGIFDKNKFSNKYVTEAEREQEDVVKLPSKSDIL